MLRQRPALAGVPVLVLTALRFAEARGVARGGFADFLTELFDPGAVVRRATASWAAPARRRPACGPA